MRISVWLKSERRSPSHFVSFGEDLPLPAIPEELPSEFPPYICDSAESMSISSSDIAPAPPREFIVSSQQLPRISRQRFRISLFSIQISPKSKSSRLPMSCCSCAFSAPVVNSAADCFEIPSTSPMFSAMSDFSAGVYSANVRRRQTSTGLNSSVESPAVKSHSFSQTERRLISARRFFFENPSNHCAPSARIPGTAACR